MTRAITGIVSLVVVACLGLPMLLLTAVMGGGSKGCGAAALPNMHPFGRPPTVGAWDVEQVDVAAIIIDIGAQRIRVAYHSCGRRWKCLRTSRRVEAVEWAAASLTG